MTEEENAILEKFPFMTLAKYLEDEYLGIVVNKNFQTFTMYLYNHNLTPEMKLLFLKLGDKWWWETNRRIPINIALFQEWQIFAPFLRLFNAKDLKIIKGPICSVQDIPSKRIKRKHIQLVSKLN